MTRQALASVRFFLTWEIRETSMVCCGPVGAPNPSARLYYSAEVPLGPIRSTETIASPPHGAPACRETPTACASQARDSAKRSHLLLASLWQLATTSFCAAVSSSHH